MAAQYKTRCPHCQAQFRIGEEHLRQAKGQVRCGSCLKVFLATENLVGATPKPAAPKTNAARAATQSTPGPEDWQMPGADAGSRWTLGEEADAPAAGSEAGDRAGDKEGDEEANDTRLNLGGLELSDSFLSAGQDDDDERLRDDDFSDMAGVASGGSSSATDESWAEQLLEELEDEPDAPVAQAARPASSTAGTPRRPESRHGSRRAASTEEEDEWAHDIESANPFDADTDSLLDSLPHEDLSVLDLDQTRDHRSGPRGGGVGEVLRWGLASVALLGLLAGQYAAFEFDELARRPALRPLYAALCDRLPCELPPLTDITVLRASNLVVRPHPEAEGALMIDLLLHNDGAAQPWPDLELGFTSLEGTPVASRRFAPSEYLRGDAAASDRIPAETPVHVSLEIVDPGKRAVNYTLRPLPPAENTRG